MDTFSESPASVSKELFWPQVMFPEDLALAFKISRQTASQWLNQGRFGPYVQIGRRKAVLKWSLLEYLTSKQISPDAEQPPLCPLRNEDPEVGCDE